MKSPFSREKKHVFFCHSGFPALRKCRGVVANPSKSKSEPRFCHFFALNKQFDITFPKLSLPEGGFYISYSALNMYSLSTGYEHGTFPISL